MCGFVSMQDIEWVLKEGGGTKTRKWGGREADSQRYMEVGRIHGGKRAGRKGPVSFDTLSFDLTY